MKTRFLILIFIMSLTQGCCVFQKGSWVPFPCRKEQREELKKEREMKKSNKELKTNEEVN